MSYAWVHSACLSGLGIIEVIVEVDIQPGLPLFTIIGLPDRAVEEARQRVRHALKNSGHSLPMGKVTVNLSPSTIRKQGSELDLAIAIAILAASGKVRQPSASVWVVGELSLNGEIVPIPLLPAILVEGYRKRVGGVVIPLQSESDSIPECPNIAVSNLGQCIQLFQMPLRFVKKARIVPKPEKKSDYALDHIKGQSVAKRALEIALAGGFNILFSGPPGSGKTMLAEAAWELLPRPDRVTQLESIQVQAIAGSLIEELPFRRPHHSVSLSAMLGSPRSGKLGELVLAHAGVLFLDELPEYHRDVREALREPLQDKVVRFSYQGRMTAFPAACVVIGAQNYCPCGMQGSCEPCRCQPKDIVRYRRSLSEPLLERFQLFCEVPKIDYAAWSRPGESIGEEVAERIQKVRQTKLKVPAILPQDVNVILKRAATTFSLSARRLNQLIDIASVISRLSDCETIKPEHMQEALSYRYRPPE